MSNKKKEVTVLFPAENPCYLDYSFNLTPPLMSTSLRSNKVLVFTKLQKYSQRLDENSVVLFVSLNKS